MNIVEQIREAARNGGGRLVFHADAEPRYVEADELYAAALLRTGRFVASGAKPGDRIGVVGPNAPDWVEWAWATWMLGATLVPLPIPLRVRDRAAVASHLSALAHGFDCTLIATHEKFAALLPAEMVLEWEDTGSTEHALTDDDFAALDLDSLALILPTSGSTSAPKGVGRTYDAMSGIPDQLLMMNPLGADVVRYLSYSPIAHAGGSLALYSPMVPWLEAHTLAPDRFARDPGALFRLVGPFQITMLGGASSGIAAALRSIERKPDGVDLSSITSLSFAFEMVDPGVVEHLVDLGGRLGLDPGAVTASYGLSEGGGTSTTPGNGIHIGEFDLDELVTNGVAREPTPGVAVKRIVSCGSATRADMRIKGPAGVVPERHLGEVQFRGDLLMRGYEGPGAEDPFEDGGWMRTGDLGFVADGELFITGRIKEVLVRHGKKYHPEDIELAAAQGADVAGAACVAFIPADGEEGEIVVAVETSSTDGLDDLERRVRSAVTNKVGIPLRSVVFVAAETLPKASSGKAQRIKARDMYARDELELIDR